MKQKLFLLLVLLVTTSGLYSQSPSAFKYQAVARDANNVPIGNQVIGLRISLLNGSSSGQSVYSEIFNPMTTDLGIFAINIGEGSPQSGNFPTNWSDAYWLMIEMDATGGSNYQIMGVSKLQSVPYALHANSVDNKDDADADPTNELQTLSLQNDTLSISGTNSKIHLPTAQSPWVRVPDSEIIDFQAESPLARVKNQHSTLNLASDGLNFIDTSDCSTFLGNGILALSVEDLISDDLVLLSPAATLTKDSLTFDSYGSILNSFSRSNLNNRALRFSDQIGGNRWTSSLEGFQLDLRFNDDEVWANYDAYGIQAFTQNDPSIPNNWDLFLKTGVGLYLGEDNAQDALDASLTNPHGFYLGSGPGLGILDETYTFLNKDSLTFNYIVNNGLLSGFASYGRDQLSMSFQAGPQGNSTCLSPHSLCFETDFGGNVNRMDLNSDFLEFQDPNGGFSVTHVGLDSLFLSTSVGLLLPSIAKLKSFELSFEDFANQSFFHSYGFSVKEILSDSDIFDRATLRPDAFTMFNSAKWRNVQLGTIESGNAGHLTLWSGTGDFKLVELGHDNLDGLAGSLQLFSSNSGAHASAWLRAQNQRGQLSLDGPNTLNIYMGDINGGDRGYLSVYDAAGTSSAGMFVTSADQGAIWADIIHVGENPGNTSTYPFKVVQNPNFGMNLERSDKGSNWELFVDLASDLNLYNSGNFRGPIFVS